MSVYHVSEQSNPIVANAVAYGRAYDGNSKGLQYAIFRGCAASDVAGIISIQQSDDNETWFVSTSQPVAAGFENMTIIESLWSLRYTRVMYSNGTSDQSFFKLASTFVSED